MKKPPISRLAWAAFAVAIAAGTLVAQDGDASSRKPQLLAEALKARDEGNLPVALEKFEAILKIDDKDPGATEGLASVKAALAAAEASLAKSKAPVAAEQPAPKPAVVANPLEEVASRNTALFAEINQAIAEARKQSAQGNHKRALEIVDGALASLPSITSAQPSRESLVVARQELIVARESGDKGTEAELREEARLLAQANAEKLRKAGLEIARAEALIRQSTAQSLDEGLAVLEKIDKERQLPSDFTARPSLERIKSLKAGALARRAFLAMEAREMTKADALIRDYENILGAENPSARRLRAEYNAKKANPTYRNIDELSPSYRGKDDKVRELLVKGRARYLYGDYQGSLEAYREVLQYQPNNSESKAYQVRIREILSENSGQWNRGVTKGKLLELLDETWKLPEVYNREANKDAIANLTDPALEKLRSIIVPEINIRDLPLDRAVQQLNNVSQSYDKDQKGVNMVVIDPERKNPPVNITLRQVSLEKALEIITKGVNFTFTVNQGIVEIRPDSGSSDQETEFFPLSQAATIKMTGMSSVNGGGAGAPGATAANPFGGAPTGGNAGGGDGQRPEEIAIRNFFIRSGVNFEAQGASLAYDGTNLIVTQNRKNLDRVRNILRRYSDIKQVHIETKFIEVNENTLNELGANWRITDPLTGSIRAQTNLRSVNGVFGGATVARPGSITVGGNTTPLANVPPQFPTANTGSAEPNFGGASPGGSVWGGVAGSYLGKVGMIGDYDLSVFLKAVEQNSGTDLMSSPSLTVLDGKTAMVKIAQLLRYPQSYGDTQSNVGTAGANGGGGAGVTITAGTPQDFTVQEVGVTLEVTPTVQADDAIALNLKPKVIEFEGFVEYGGTSVAIAGNTTVLVPSGYFQPIFTTREVSTDVTVFDGATVVIGGLTREEVKTVNDKVPVLGDIPLVGAAFRSTGKTTTKRNLMVFVTANLVSPGGATLRSSHPGMRAGTTFSNPILASPGGAVYREPNEAATPAVAPAATEGSK